MKRPAVVDLWSDDDLMLDSEAGDRLMDLGTALLADGTTDTAMEDVSRPNDQASSSQVRPSPGLLGPRGSGESSRSRSRSKGERRMIKERQRRRDPSRPRQQLQADSEPESL